MDYTETTLEREELYRGRIIEVHRDRVRLSDGSTSVREVVEHNGGVGVLPIDAEGRVCCVRQYRYAFGEHVLEMPAGKLEAGEDPRAAAIRELEEECGLVADKVTELGCIYPSVGYDDEIIYLYLAEKLHRTAPRPDSGEFLTLETRSLEELRDMAMAGTLRDAKTVAAVLKTVMLRAAGQG